MKLKKIFAIALTATALSKDANVFGNIETATQKKDELIEFVQANERVVSSFSLLEKSSIEDLRKFVVKLCSDHLKAIIKELSDDKLEEYGKVKRAFASGAREKLEHLTVVLNDFAGLLKKMEEMSSKEKDSLKSALSCLDLLSLYSEKMDEFGEDNVFLNGLESVGINFEDLKDRGDAAYLAVFSRVQELKEQMSDSQKEIVRKSINESGLSKSKRKELLKSLGV